MVTAVQWPTFDTVSQIKLVAIDIDNTLIKSDMQIPLENIQAINKTSAKGIIVVIVSGRSSSSVRKYMEILSLKTIVPSLGGCMLEEWNGKIIQDYSLSKEDALFIYDTAVKYNHLPIAFYHGDWFSDKRNTKWNDFEYYATHVGGHFPDLRQFFSETNLNKIIVPSTDSVVLSEIEKEVNTKIGDRVYGVYSSPRYLEFMPYGITKATAIRNLLDYYKLAKDEILAIGDFYNDIGMFQEAGNKAAVQNAPDKIKKIVDYVSPLDNNQGGVADILKHYKLT